MTRFLGDTPLRVAIRLLLLSLLVGWVMQWLDLTPFDVIDQGIDLVERAWNAGVAGLGRFGGTIALGAVIVVPFFLINRLVNYRRG